jgi:hypothetical protein
MGATLEKIRYCCKNSKFFLIVFDGAGTADLPILVCEDCSQKPLFQKFTKQQIPINFDSDVNKILNSF